MKLGQRLTGTNTYQLDSIESNYSISAAIQMDVGTLLRQTLNFCSKALISAQFIFFR